MDPTGLHETLAQWYERHGISQGGQQNGIDWQYYYDTTGVIGPAAPQSDEERLQSLNLTIDCLERSDYGSDVDRNRRIWEYKQEAHQLGYLVEWETNPNFRIDLYFMIMGGAAGGGAFPKPIGPRPPGGGIQWGMPTGPVGTLDVRPNYNSATATVRGWTVGDPINHLTSAGRVPAWSTVRERIWKNEAYCNRANYSYRNLARMRDGLAPQRINPVTGRFESKELHHDPPQRDGGLFDVLPVWPPDHQIIDPFR